MSLPKNRLVPHTIGVAPPPQQPPDIVTRGSGKRPAYFHYTDRHRGGNGDERSFVGGADPDKTSNPPRSRAPVGPLPPATRLYAEKDWAGDQEDDMKSVLESWPRTEELEAPLLSALCSSRLPCVRQAVFHLGKLQIATEEWSRDKQDQHATTVAADSSQESSALPASDPIPLMDLGRLRASDSRRPDTLSSKNPVAETFSSSSGNAAAEAAAAAAEAIKSRPEGERGRDIPYSGAEDVFLEALTLLAKLEMDRQETQKKCEKEKENHAKMKDTLQQFQQAVLTQLPEEVEKAHGMHNQDRRELVVKLGIATRKALSHQRKLKRMEELNMCFREGISCLTDQRASIPEKMAMEEENMLQIKKAKEQKKRELKTTKMKLIHTKEKLGDASVMALVERELFQREMDKERDKLSRLNVELFTDRVLYRSYVQQIKDTPAHVKDVDWQLTIDTTRRASLATANERKVVKLTDLKNKLAEATSEHQRLAKENEESERTLGDLKTRSAALAELKAFAENLELDLTGKKSSNEKLRENSKKHQAEIEECKLIIRQCAERLYGLRVERFIVDDGLETVEKGLKLARKQNVSLAETLDTVRTQKLHDEESLGFLVDSLLHQLKEEARQKRWLQVRCESDSIVLNKLRVSMCKRRSFLKMQAKPINKANDALLADLKKLRAALVASDRKISDLQLQIDDMRDRHLQTSERYRRRLQDLESVCTPLRTELGDLEEALMKLLAEVEDAEEERRRVAVRKYQENYQKTKSEARPGDFKQRRGVSDSVLVRGKPETRDVGTRGARSDPAVSSEGADDDVDRQSSCPQLLARMRGVVTKLDKILQHMAWRTDIMTSKINAMESQVHTQAAHLADIATLTQELEETRAELQTARRIRQDLWRQNEAVDERKQAAQRRHSLYISARNRVLQTLQADTVRCLASNKRLASRYRHLQHRARAAKEKVSSAYDEHQTLEAGAHDVKALDKLQSRMRHALDKYQELRALDAGTRLARLEQADQENEVRVGHVHSRLRVSLASVTDLLTGCQGSRSARQGSLNEQDPEQDVAGGQRMEEQGEV